MAGGVSERDIYNALTKSGYNMEQAAGIMGNMQNESSFNVESSAVDSNGYTADGLISWNQASYPNAGNLVTGNPKKDLKDQVKYLRTQTNGVNMGLQGTSAEEVAGNWAQYVEVCKGCAPGGAQWTQRRANAQTIFQEAKAGNWPSGPGVGTHSKQHPTKTTTTSIFSSLGNINSFFADMLSADFWERAALIFFGAILVIVGILVLTKTGGMATKLATSRIGGNAELSGPSEAQIQNRQARLAIAQRNSEIGERRQALRERKEARSESDSNKSHELRQRREERTAGHNERSLKIRESSEKRRQETHDRRQATKKHKSGSNEPNPSPRHS